VLVEDELRPWRHPAPYDFHLSSSGMSGPGVDADLAAHVTVARRAGIALHGPAATEVLPEVPHEDFIASLWSDFEDCVASGGSRYAVLSIARVWASLAEPERLHTKVSGGEWALARIPQGHRGVLERVLDSYRTHGRDVEIDAAEFRGYADFVAEQVRGLRAPAT
jgi:streptomycin 3"-adenylyltransferase